MDTSFLRYTGKGIEVLTDRDAKTYGVDDPLPPRDLGIVPVDPKEADKVYPRIIVGGHPVGDYFGSQFPMTCGICSATMVFVLQIQSSFNALGFSVWDGETL